MKLMLGADPEVFIRNIKTGEFVSAHGLIPGTKEKPHKVRNGAVQVDGMAAEFNIDPAETEDEFVNNIKSVMEQLQEMLPKDHEIVITPCATFSDEEWARVPDDAKILGCEPDYNAYTGEENSPPNADRKFRTAAGHIHFGWTEGVEPKHLGHFEACCTLSKELDYHLGLASTFVDCKEESVQRRELYGAPGAFRPKSYGCEYRVLSNWWLQKEEYMRWVYKISHKVFNNLLQGEFNHQELSENVKEGLGSKKKYSLPDIFRIVEGLELPPEWEDVYFENEDNPFNEAYYFFGQKENTRNSLWI